MPITQFFKGIENKGKGCPPFCQFIQYIFKVNLITENSSENGKLKLQQETGDVNVLECCLLFVLM